MTPNQQSRADANDTGTCDSCALWKRQKEPCTVGKCSGRIMNGLTHEKQSCSEHITEAEAEEILQKRLTRMFNEGKIAGVTYKFLSTILREPELKDRLIPSNVLNFLQSPPTSREEIAKFLDSIEQEM